MRRSAPASLLVVLVLSLGIPSGAQAPARAAASPPARQSNPGQLNVVTVNAAQARILERKRFERLFELARALRLRPAAFDGGTEGAAAVPDVILLHEMRFSNLEIFKRLLKQRLPYMYEIVGAEGATAKLLVNLDRVTPSGAGGTWDDVCLGGTDVAGGRTYQWVGLTENATGAQLIAASVHFSNQYAEEDCLARNIAAMRTALDGIPGAIVVGGDFNKRATEAVAECDPDEQTPPLAWYTAMTAPTAENPGYEDAVVVAQRRRGRSLVDQWTFERGASSPGCTGAFSLRRSRIDYIFVRGATIADASADHPGWAGTGAATRHPINFKYSDHRFVSARIILNSLTRPEAPAATRAAGGVVRLTWSGVSDATSYVVLRSVGGRPYTPIASVAAPATTYDDVSTRHGRVHSYSVVAVGVGGQGWESIPVAVTPDARGPAVVSTSPRRGAGGVARTTNIEVRFDEAVAPSGVDQTSVRLMRAGNAMRARVVQTAPRVLQLDPVRKLRRGTTYRVVVQGLSDAVGNRGRSDAWKFTTR